jgi:hypothetical protein
MGLAKLYRVTGDERYLALARFMLDERGPRPGEKTNPRGLTYNQAHAPVVDQTEPVGHAVRAAYMYSGMADVAALTGDPGYLKAGDAIWNSVIQKKFYITGGIGSSGRGEAFGDDYELPNMTAYNETCASIGADYWNHRLFLLHADAKSTCSSASSTTGPLRRSMRALFSNLLARTASARSTWARRPKRLVRLFAAPRTSCASSSTRGWRCSASATSVNLVAGRGELSLRASLGIRQETRYLWTAGSGRASSRRSAESPCTCAPLGAGRPVPSATLPLRRSRDRGVHSPNGQPVKPEIVGLCRPAEATTHRAHSR